MGIEARNSHVDTDMKHITINPDQIYPELILKATLVYRWVYDIVTWPF